MEVGRLGTGTCGSTHQRPSPLLQTNKILMWFLVRAVETTYGVPNKKKAT